MTDQDKDKKDEPEAEAVEHRDVLDADIAPDADRAADVRGGGGRAAVAGSVSRSTRGGI